MQEVTAIYNYTTERDGNYTVFTYKKTPVSYKLAMPLCFYTAIPAAMLAFAIGAPGFVSGIILWVILMVGLGLGITFTINKFRKTGEFKISDTDVVVKDKCYARKDIVSYFVKDPSGNYVETTTMYVTQVNPLSVAGNVANLGTGLRQLGAESRNMIRKHLQDAGYKIYIRYGTKDIVIASGLGQREADGMFDKLTEVAGLNKK